MQNKHWFSLVLVTCLITSSCGIWGGKSDEDKAPLQLVILGGPGAGKGTQARYIHDTFGIPHISTGDILRAEVAAGTELGKQVKDIMDAGNLVSNKIVLDLVEKRIAEPDCDVGFILDGFPRTLPQASGLETILERMGKDNVAVINLYVPDVVLMDRLLARKRADYTEETIRNRIRVYHRQTTPLIDYYRDRNTMVEINGNRDIEKVSRDIDSAVKKLIKKL